jgi:hypothetical protein
MYQLRMLWWRSQAPRKSHLQTPWLGFPLSRLRNHCSKAPKARRPNEQFRLAYRFSKNKNSRSASSFFAAVAGECLFVICSR